MSESDISLSSGDERHEVPESDPPPRGVRKPIPPSNLQRQPRPHSSTEYESKSSAAFEEIHDGEGQQEQG